MWVNRMLDLCCDFQCPPHPWTWPWIFKVKFWKCCISGMGGTIDMERKGCESIGCYTHFVTPNFDFKLDLGFQGQILKKLYLRNGMANWHGIKGMWVDRMLDPCCDFQLSLHSWPWPWIFKVKFWKKSRSNFEKSISGMGWLIDMEKKRCESINVRLTLWLQTLTSPMTLTLDFEGKVLKLL